MCGGNSLIQATAYKQQQIGRNFVLIFSQSNINYLFYFILLSFLMFDILNDPADNIN